MRWDDDWEMRRRGWMERGDNYPRYRDEEMGWRGERMGQGGYYGERHPRGREGHGRGGEPMRDLGEGYDETYRGRRNMRRRFGTGRYEPGPYSGRGPKGWTRSNERIRDDVCERMCDHGMLDASDIEIDVADGEVTLTGTVEDRMQKRLAEDLADDVNGVRDVHNQLRIEEREREPTEGRQRRTTNAPTVS